MLEKGENVDVIYTDFEKAYEKVDHFTLLHKMKTQFGIDGQIGKWFQKFLENRKQQKIIEETKSEKSEVKSGSIQGSVLGTVFFLMFGKDMSKNITAHIIFFLTMPKIRMP